MKKTTYTTTAIALLIASISACDSSDMPIQHPDNYEYITFAAKTQIMTTRSNDYEDYNSTMHPTTMGVFGYHDIKQYDALATTRATSPKANPIFNNDIATYNPTNNNWATSPLKPWDDYLGASSFDFFAYMPQNSGATISRTATDTYQLSVPFAIADGKYIISDTKQAPIVCALPIHKENTTAGGNEFTFERMIDLQFDQTLTAYTLLFRLDTRMGSIRKFRIKKVEMSGYIATSGMINRTYQWTGTEWTAGNIAWTNINRQLVADKKIEITNNASATTDGSSQALEISTTTYLQWGNTIYTIPDEHFQPTFSVTYDIELTAEDGKSVITRNDVTSDITLNKNNFSNLATAKTAIINPIRILVQPRYLYVLADDDAYTGHLLID